MNKSNKARTAAEKVTQTFPVLFELNKFNEKNTLTLPFQGGWKDNAYPPQRPRKTHPFQKFNEELPITSRILLDRLVFPSKQPNIRQAASLSLSFGNENRAALSPLLSR